MVDAYSIRDGADGATVFNGIREDMTSNFQARIPAVTQASIADTLATLEQDITLYNEFADALVNRIGMVYGRTMSWTNPLSQFKKGMLSYGSEIEEYQTGILKAHTYDPDRNYMEKEVFGQERVQTESIFHKINRQNYYKITINHNLLRRAFLDDGGVNAFVKGFMSAPVTSDNLDEFLAMCNLIPAYEQNHGFYKVHIPDVAADTSSADDAKVALRKLRGLAGNLRFLSTKYNAKHMPSFANAEDLILITTPEFMAAIDVEALAAAFNVSYADFSSRTVLVPKEQLPVDKCQAILTSRDFFQIYDTLIHNTSIQNPVGVYNNYFFHHRQIISQSLFVPAVMLWTGADSAGEAITVYTPNTLSVSASPLDDGTVPSVFLPGETYHFDSGAVSDPAGGAVPVSWTVSGANSAKTFITDDGNLHIASDETATSVIVKATSLGDNKTTGKTVTSQKTVNITQPSAG